MAAGHTGDAMPAGAPAGRPLLEGARDLAQLGKPRITLLVLLTSGVGLWMAPGSLAAWRMTLFLLATAFLVASANTLNCWVERDTDARMRRTRERPLPAGRLSAGTALAAGLVEGLSALAVLLWVTNPLTAALGALALATYVLVYTPMKRVSWWAVVVGAVPGAIPPLMGWTAITGSMTAPGWALFGILFFWQLPHFIAISLYLKEDYRRGGLQVLPIVRGEAAARRHLFLHTVLLTAVSLSVLPLGLAGTAYLVAAGLLGAGFLYLAGSGLRPTVGGAWARRVFAYSLLYLPVLICVLVLDAH